uniref:Metallothionein n=1 Tax=Gouania willdenowi TaxID=441366 RepID=A0A8C5HUX0_GOUWI
ETRKKCGCSCSVPGCSCGARKQPYLSNHRDEGPESVDFVSGSTIRRLKSGAVPSLFPYVTYMTIKCNVYPILNRSVCFTSEVV